MRTEISNSITRGINSHSKSINLSGMQITGAKIKEILLEIKQESSEITHFNFNNNNLGDEGAAVLNELLPEFPNLTTLSVQFNNMGEKGVTSVLNLLKTFPELDIGLHGNLFSDAGKILKIEHQIREQNNSTCKPRM